MLVECPHCFTRVLPRPDGQCPSCQQSTQSIRDADRESVTVIVRENSQMPDFCCTCMIPERRLVRVVRSRDVPGTSDVAGSIGVRFALQLLLPLIGDIIHIAFGAPKSSNSQAVVVRVRQCRECSRHQPLEPVFVNFDGYNMKFVAHRNFAKLFTELNTVP
jgi:hypothetical protein